MIELPQAIVRDYPGGYAKWHADMSAKLTREANARFSKTGNAGRTSKTNDPKELGKKSGRLAATPKYHLSEHDEQALVIARAEMLASSVPELRMLFAIPNGGARSKATAGKLKAEGVKSGVSDLFLSVGRGGYHGLYIEMKAQGGRASDEQKAWIAAAKEYGYRAEICVGADAAWAVICEYLGIREVGW